MHNEGMKGSGPFEGMTWTGRAWVGDPTPQALAARAEQPWVAAPGTAAVGRSRLEQLVQGVLFAVLAVVCVAAATPAVMLFGASTGGLIALACLVVGGIFAIMAIAKA